MEATRTNEFTAANIHVLKQAAQLLDRLDDKTYCAPMFGPRSAIGVHLRHALDFYALFFDGLPGGQIDYDRRTRDRTVEQSRGVALDYIDSVIERLRAIDDLAAPVRVKVDVADSSDDPDAYSQSTVKRELQSLVGHTLHHYALITYSLKAQGIEVDPGFGVAPSTLDYWQKMQGEG